MRAARFRLYVVAFFAGCLAIAVAWWFADWNSVSAPARGTGISLHWLALWVLAIVFQGLLAYVGWHRWLRPRPKVISTQALNGIVHEFQSPLAAIRMAVDILQSPMAKQQPERAAKYVGILHEETQRLQHQVDMMLTLARADQNTLRLNPEPLLLHDLLRSIAKRHGDYLTLHLSGYEPRLLADKLHLTNVLYNLIDNAVKYSPQHPDITIQTRYDTDGFDVTIRDRGVGISPAAIPHIFQPFYRIQDRSQPNVKGFGLGLSYVQRIVEAHRWHIWVKSAIGKGTEFVIHIPPSALLPSLTIQPPQRVS